MTMQSVRSLCQVVGDLLKITTGKVEFADHHQQAAQIQVLFDKASKILLESCNDIPESQFKTVELSFLLDCFSHFVNEIQTRITDHHDKISPAIPQSQLARFVSINALTYTLVGIHNLLITSLSATTDKDYNCPSALSTNEESLIRIAVCHTLRIAFMPTLKCYFNQAEVLCPTSRSNNNMKQTIVEECMVKDEIIILKPIYLLFVKLLMELNSSPTILQETIKKDCFSIITAVYVILQRDYRVFNCPFNAQLILSLQADHFFDEESSIQKKLVEFMFSKSNQEVVIRDLLLLIRCKTNKPLLSIISGQLYKHYTQPDGLEVLLRSTLDSDITSQRETTIQQRLQAIANMVCSLPVRDKDCYLTNVLEQVLTGLLGKQQRTDRHAVDIYWRTGAMIIELVNEAEPELIQECFLDPIKQTFNGERSSVENLSIETCILVVHRLILARTCVQNLQQFFTPLFYIRLSFEQTISPLRSILDETLIEILKETPNSIYVLDDCIHVQQEQWFQKISVEINSNDQSVTYNIKNLSQASFSEENLESSNTIATFVLNLLKKMPTGYRFDYFFLLLDRLIAPQPSPVTVLLIGPFSENLFGSTISKHEEEERENLLLSGKRTVQFLCSTFQRVINRLIKPKEKVLSEPATSTEDNSEIWKETLSACLRILSILLEKLDKVDLVDHDNDSQCSQSNGEEGDFKQENLLNELKPCHISLGILLQNGLTSEIIDPFERILAEQIYSQFESIYNKSLFKESNPKSQTTSQLNKCLSELQHPLMPVRAHALITIKQLIYSRDSSIEINFEKILAALKQCMADTESYIYLAAINTLGALAIRHTETVLPFLLEQFLENDATKKPLAIRLKIGEVLMQLAHSIGDFAYHFSTTFISGLLRGMRSEEPAFRISCLSCLGEFCNSFKNGLSKYIVELVSMAEQILSSDPNLEVRRAAVLFLRLLLNGITSESVLLIQDQLKSIKEAIVKAKNSTLDDVMELQCSLANDELSRIVRDLMKQSNGNDKFLKTIT